MDIGTYSQHRNAKAAAVKMVTNGTSPSAEFEIVPAEDGRFAIQWEQPLPEPEQVGAESAPEADGLHADLIREALPIPETSQKPETGAAPLAAKTPNRLAEISDLLRRPEGATIDEIRAVTGWLPHTCRAFLSVQVKRKAGLEVTTEKVEGRGRVYRIAP